MNRKSLLPWFGFLILAALFAGVFLHSMGLRAGKGDIYPPYSASRHDPLGGSGLLDAYERLPGVSAVQNQTSLMSIDGLGENDALFLLGLPSSSFDGIRVPDQSPVLQAVRDRGTRLVITLHPDSFFGSDLVLEDGNDDTDGEDWLEKRRRLREEREKKKKGGPGVETDQKKKKEESKEKESEDEEPKKESPLGPKLGQRFHLALKPEKGANMPAGGWKAEPGSTIQDQPVPPLPAWRSPWRFEPAGDDGKEWKTVAAVEKKPVIVERRFGKGSIVMTTDSYFASNEALRQGGDGVLLLWLAGGKTRILFDETLHGSEQKLGVVKMLRQYRLHGVLIGILFFLVLWAWRSASSLAPGNEDLEKGLVGEGRVSGEDTQSGFVRLLRRNILGKELIAQCLQTWRTSQQVSLPEEKERSLAETLNRHLNNPKELGVVSAYREIAKILKKH